MSAHKSITARWRSRSARRGLISLALIGGALAGPAAASARPIDSGPYVAPTAQSAAPAAHSVTVTSQTIGRPNEGFVSPDHLRYTGPPLDVSQPVASNDAFDWGDAGLGAAVGFALTALAGAAVVIRRRSGLSPSPS